MGCLHRALAYCHLVSPQTFTGMVPFNETPPAGAILAIMRGERPPRPTHPALTDPLWTIIQCCWDQDPHLRPQVSKVLQVLLSPSVSHPVSVIAYCGLDGFLVISDTPAWKHLINSTLAANKRIPLILAMFSDHHEIEIAGHLCRDDAQAFVNIIDEVSLHTRSPEKNESVFPLPKLLRPVVRHWIVSHHGFVKGACVHCTGFAAAKLCFQDH